MAVFNSLTFDGENSLDYGVYITGEAVYNAPERAVELISIPGRNGAIALDQGRFENIEITYPAGTFGDDQPEFASKIRAFRNALASRFNYVKLTDSYHPDEYRLGLYKSGLTTTPVQRSKAGEFPIVFNCKPQRFLTSGETEVDGNAWSNVQTGSGSIVTIDNADGETGIKSLVANIEPIQSGGGTPSPTNVRLLSGRAAVNITRARKNIAKDGYAWNIDGTGKVISNVSYNCSITPIKAGNTYTYSLNGTKGTISVIAYYSTMPTIGSVSYDSQRYASIDGTFTAPISGYAVIRSGLSAVNIQVENGSTATSYEPYDEQVYTDALGRTVYKGTLDVATGLLTVTHGVVQFTGANRSGAVNSSYYAYNTREMPSDIVTTTYPVDAYCDCYSVTASASGRVNGTFYLLNGNIIFVNDGFTSVADANTLMASQKPTVIYPLATPLTYQLTPEEVDLLLGTNNIWADSGNITVQYGNSPVYNPTEFDARPLIKVVGIGTAVVGDTAITITGTAGQTIYIDCDSMEIYKLNGGTPQSAASLVSFSGNDFPKLKAGSNTVALGTGITSVTITPRWWII